MTVAASTATAGFGAPVSDGGSSYVTVLGSDIAAGAVVIKAVPGRLCRVLLTTANGANQVNITDGVGGPIIGAIAANAAAGSLLNFQITAQTSINIPQTASAPNLTITIM